MHSQARVVIGSARRITRPSTMLRRASGTDEPASVFVPPSPKIRAPSISVRIADLSHKECTMNSPPKSTLKRYLALDLHKHYLVVGGVNRL
jgi:hypothetical protein